MDSEKQKLIQTKDKQETGTRSSLQKYVILCIATVVYLMGTLTISTIQSEWVQHKVLTDKFPNLISTKKNTSACHDTNRTDPVYRNYTIVQQESARWNMYFTYALDIPMFFMNMILNTYTDTYGRKYLLVLSVLGVCIKYWIVSAVIYFNQSLWFIFGASIIDGLLGSFYGTLAAMFAYVADISKDQHNRVLGIVVLESIFMVTAVISNPLSGFLVETLNLGFANAALICSATMSIGLLIHIFLVQESLDKSKRTPLKPVLGTVKQMFKFYVSSEFKGKRLKYILLLASFCMAVVSSGNRSSLEILYFLALPFCWDPSRIGIYLSVRHAVQGCVGILLLKPLQLILSNEAIAVFGTISNTGSYVLEGFATTDLMIYMVPVAGVFSFICIPIIRSIMSVITEPDKQGALFSSIATMEVLSSIIASAISNEVYAASYAVMHGFVFLFLGGICVINFVIMLAYYILNKVKSDDIDINQTVVKVNSLND